MKIGFKKIIVNPIVPTVKFAPRNNGSKVLETKDELACKVLLLEKDILYIHMSMPLGGVTLELREKLYNKIKETVAKDFHLTLCATHTHYAPDLTMDKDYEAFLIEKISEEMKEISVENYEDISYSFQYEYFDKVGTSRISGQPSKNLFLETLSIYTGSERIATLIVYNCHPTTLNFNEDYFSGGGPAVLMKNLEEKYQGEFFTYMIGAAGDVSTRFNRKGQTYEDMLALNSLVQEEVEQQLNKQSAKMPVNEFKIEELWLEVEHEPRDMSLIDTSGELTARELETIEIAKEKHKHIDLSILPDKVLLQRFIFGGHIFIFTPFELFSVYMDSIEKDHVTLVNCANDRIGYLSGTGVQKMCFEVLGETIPERSKEKLKVQLGLWSKL